ncbi:MAG: tetratricopeptide repeat protein [Sneathiella sp.]
MTFSCIAVSAAGCKEFEAYYEKREYASAMKELMPLVAERNAYAQYSFAAMAFTGRGMHRDKQRSVEMFRLSAVQEFPPALWALGNFYLYGDIVERDHEEALRLFKAAALRGYGPAFMTLGLLYESGREVAQDLITANAMYKVSHRYFEFDEPGAPRPGFNQNTRDGIERTELHLSQQEIAEADELVRELRSKVREDWSDRCEDN